MRTIAILALTNQAKLLIAVALIVGSTLLVGPWRTKCHNPASFETAICSREALDQDENTVIGTFSSFSGFPADAVALIKRAERCQRDTVASSVPADFDWRGYITMNPGLGSEGVVDELTAMQHYSSYGSALKMRYQRPRLMIRYESGGGGKR